MNELRKALKVLAAVALGAWLAGHSRPALAAEKKTKASSPTAASAPRVVELRVTAKGFEPSPVHVRKGEPLELRITRTTEETCATEVVLPEQKLQAALPLNQTVTLKLTPEKSGELKYGCGMGMMESGVLVVE